MNLDAPSAGSRKRTADEEIQDMDIFERSLTEEDDNMPFIIRRYQHRRRNLAAPLWGRSIATATAPAHPTTPPLTNAAPQPFNVYKAILRHPNLFFQFALRLPYPSVIDLYAIDKEFHYRLNKYSVSMIHDYARYHAPLAGFIFSWLLYPRICISDPMLRPMDGRVWLARDVPGFRWVGMVLLRDKVIRGILTNLALEGHRVPAGCAGALMKYWVLMEMKTTELRQAFLQDKYIWTDADILFFQLFLVKLDMRFADPILGNGICEFSHLLLTQRSLITLWKVLTGRLKLDYDVTGDMIIHTYPTEELDTENVSWLDDEGENGVPEQWWGVLTSEEWDTDGSHMESAVDNVIAEGIRRQLNVQQYHLDFVLYGHLDENTGANIPIPTKFRRNSDIVLHEGKGYPVPRVKKRLIASLEDGSKSESDERDDRTDTSGCTEGERTLTRSCVSDDAYQHH